MMTRPQMAMFVAASAAVVLWIAFLVVMAVVY